MLFNSIDFAVFCQLFLQFIGIFVILEKIKL